MDALLALRKSLSEQGLKASVNDFIVKAVAVTLQVKYSHVDFQFSLYLFTVLLI